MRLLFLLLLLLAPSSVTFGAPLTGAPAAATGDRATAGGSAWVSRRVEAWQPTASERSWSTIGWAAGLGEALRLGKEHKRPIFLFTLDGRMGAGRC